MGKELLKAAAAEGLEAFKGGLEYAQAQPEAEQAAFRVRTRFKFSKVSDLSNYS